ncbi:integrase core domain-containing protein [Nostocoides sp.]
MPRRHPATVFPGHRPIDRPFRSPAESTNGAIKVELVNREKWPTRKSASAAIAAYIEIYYNHQRIHSGLGYQTPREMLDGYQNHRPAA